MCMRSSGSQVLRHVCVGSATDNTLGPDRVCSYRGCSTPLSLAVYCSSELRVALLRELSRSEAPRGKAIAPNIHK